MERLSGVSCRVSITTNDTSFDEAILFTHRGLSGPVALQASSYWMPGDEIRIDLLPNRNAAHMLLSAKDEQARSRLRTILAKELPRALVMELQDSFWPTLENLPIGAISDRNIRSVANKLQQWIVKPSATEGYRTAEVTLGGVDTDELSSQTMASKRHPGLFFVGEVVDVTGHLGGYNFQWAWSSGWAAGQAV
jgi:predicted Rossmann fold flavoprotein